jgi:hypothetical protein
MIAVDSDLDEIPREQLVAEVRRLRAGIRAHRNAAGHELCWHQPDLWGMLPETTDPIPAVPDWPVFLRGCIQYRQSLDEQIPAAPRTAEEFDDGKVPEMSNRLSLRRFVVVLLLVNIWVNVSEVFRYFVIVMPATREYLTVVPDVAPMDWGVFAVWGVWDTILTAFVVGVAWLFLARYGRSAWVGLAAGSFAWMGFFVLFWLAMYNMRLSSPTLPLVALPLAWIEMIVAAYLAVWLLARPEKRRPLNSHHNHSGARP